MKRIVFTDTNALIALVCFPNAKGERLSLAQEVALIEATGECEFLICDVVAEELQFVVERSFPASLEALKSFLKKFEIVSLPMPSKQLLSQLNPLCPDPDDVPVLAAAIQSAQLRQANYLLSNDIETFHTEDVKSFAVQHGLKVVTLYGLLKALGRR